MKREYREVTQGSEFSSQPAPDALARIRPHFRLRIEKMAAVGGEAWLGVR